VRTEVARYAPALGWTTLALAVALALRPSVDPTTLFAYWEVRVATLDHVRWSRPDGVVALRVLIVTPSWDGPMSATRDIDVGESLGDWFIRDLPPGAVVRVAIGWRSGEVFLPIAHSPALETPPDKPSRLTAEVWAKWTTEGTIRLGRPDGQGGWVLESGAHERWLGATARF